MEADYIILCDGIVGSKGSKIINGGIAIKGSEIQWVGSRDEIAQYLGVDTEVYEYMNNTLITFRTGENDTHQSANIAIFAGNTKRSLAQIKKMINLQFLMYQGDIIFTRNK